MKGIEVKRCLMRAAFFALFGPLFGLIIVLIGSLVIYLSSVRFSDLNQFASELAIGGIILFFGLGYTYIIGVAPAFIAGFISGFGSNKFEETILAMLTGCFVSCAGSLIFSQNAEIATTLGLIGGLSGLCCVALRHRRIAKRAPTPIPERRDPIPERRDPIPRQP